MFLAARCLRRQRREIPLWLKHQTVLGNAMKYFHSSNKIDPDSFKSVAYDVKDEVAHIQLNRPHVLNAIDMHMPGEIQDAVKLANWDENVKVLVLSGKDGVFCSGYDLKIFAEPERGTTPFSQTMPWDPYLDFSLMSECTFAFMSLWRSLKPVVCKIEKYAIAGGSDIALCCDNIFMADDAVIGYPPARVWGCPTTAMWVYRIGLEKAKYMLFTGDLINGVEAEKIGLVGKSVQADKLDDTVNNFVDRIKSVPTNQLFFQKQVINQAVEQMGLFASQRLASVFDGMTRHSPEGAAFQERTNQVGFKQAVKERDMGTRKWKK
ncbi:probable enoyl-CoA hydratase, mitochondrial [Lingula anatina]|uniref:Probable enoyl-CoA hydratase, mitochondrial n=1 Tax=Lingula anatina TaxID=7574 RepID=A0A1S3HM51_LINAN|nr:probable enoyl-CoA hydratase, mitochondrial [Lingula anatina]XP_013386561.1 probable enoyl-CoA hydratase, mitochondrial [Lingula anatina]|eukprot:XP_013386560.1 probable enoyl-CoA hydratase, mitochondrial [Lingula anatina]